MTLWAAACQAYLSLIISQSLPKFMSIKSVMPSNHFILYHLLLLLPSIFPSTRVFSSELALPIRWPKIGTSASATILPMNIQGWFLLGLTGLIFLLSKGLSCGYILLLKYNQDNLSLATCKPHWRLKNLVLSDSIVPLMGILKLLWNFMNIYSLLCYILQWKTGKGDEQLSQN